MAISSVMSRYRTPYHLRPPRRKQHIVITQKHVLWYQVRFSKLLKDDDGDMPVRALPVDLVAAVLAGEERP